MTLPISGLLPMAGLLPDADPELDTEVPAEPSVLVNGWMSPPALPGTYVKWEATN